MQEAKGFDAGGAALLHAFEARIGMRSFLASAPRTGQNVAIFIREPVKPISFEADGSNFHHTLATLKVKLPSTERPLTLISAHLCPNGPAVRRREAAYLAVQATADAYALLTGDFNSASPHDPEPEGFDALPTHHRARCLADDLKGADRSVLAHAEAAGWVDVGHVLDKAITPRCLRPGSWAWSSRRCAAAMCWRHKPWRQLRGATRLFAHQRPTSPQITIPFATFEVAP